MAKRKFKRIKRAPRGSKQSGEINISFTDESEISEKLEVLDDETFNKKLQYAITKNKPKSGAGYKPPRAVIITVEDKDGKGKSIPSPIDMLPDKANTKEFIREQLTKIENDFADMVDQLELSDLSEEERDDFLENEEDADQYGFF